MLCSIDYDHLKIILDACIIKLNSEVLKNNSHHFCNQVNVLFFFCFLRINFQSKSTDN